jgi:hypothetical protein
MAIDADMTIVPSSPLEVMSPLAKMLAAICISPYSDGAAKVNSPIGRKPDGRSLAASSSFLSAGSTSVLKEDAPSKLSSSRRGLTELSTLLAPRGRRGDDKRRR